MNHCNTLLTHLRTMLTQIHHLPYSIMNWGKEFLILKDGKPVNISGKTCCKNDKSNHHRR
jgi:hypothetical protein